jgi:hypothetical protein
LARLSDQKTAVGKSPAPFNPDPNQYHHNPTGEDNERFKCAYRAVGMSRVRTRIAVTAFTEAEASEGLPHLLKELGQRPWLLAYDAKWVTDGAKLDVWVESQGNSLQVHGGTTGAHLDEVWDCVIACLNFSSERIYFEIEESRFVDG